MTVMHWIVRAWVVLLTLGAAILAHAQGPAFLRFDTRNGLPQSQVRVILEDRRGFIWLGTEEGVARMGAGGIVAFDLSKGFGAGRVRAMLEDSEGAIWVALTGAPLSKIQGTRVEIFNQSQGLPENNNYSLALDPQGRVLVGSTKGLYRLEGGTFRKVPLGAWDQYPVLSLIRDRSDRVWMGTRNGLVAGWDGTTLRDEQLPDGTLPRDVWRLRLDPAGRVCALTRPGLFQRAQEGGWSSLPLAGYHGVPKFQDFTFAEDGTLLVSMGDEGLWTRFPDGSSRQWTNQDGLPDEWVVCAYKDRQGILWIGTDGDGLFAQAIPGLLSLTPREILELGTVLAIEELPGQGLFLAGSRGLFRYTPGKGLSAHWTVKEGLPSNETSSLFPDGQGGLWLGTAKGLVKWRDGRILPGKSLGESRVYQVIRWRGNFIAATDQGLTEFDPQGRVLKTHDVASTIGVQDVNILLPDGDGVLVGTERGLWRFTGTQLERIHGQAPFADAQVLTIYAPNPGELWVGTARGLFHSRQGTWELLGAERGLPEANIYFVADGGHGLVAVGHGKGLSLIDPSGQLITLTQSLGLIANETNQQAFLLDAKGRFWFGLVGGVGIMNASHPPQVPQLRPPVVTEVAWAGGQQHLPVALVLPPRTEFAEFNFEAGLPLSGTAPRYETFLEGFNQNWESVSAGHAVRFPRIPAGTYRFRVRASLDGKPWLEGPPVQLRVRPTWYEHVLGQVFFVLLGIGAIFGLVLWRTNRLSQAAEMLEARVEDRTRALDQRNRELEEAHHQVRQVLDSKIAFSRMVVHDLRSPLTTMTLLADRMTSTAEERGETPPEEIDMIQREASRLETLLQRLLDQARAEGTGQTMSLATANPHEILAGLDEVLHLKATAAGLAFEFQEDPAVAQAWVLADSLALQQVVLNLFGNALKCTPPPGRLSLASRLAGGAWVLEVTDTGRGLKPSQMENLFKPFTQVEMADITQGWGLGLSIVKNLVDAHQGLIEVESTLGKGSTFRILIPLMTR